MTATQTARAPQTKFSNRDQLVLEHMDLVKAIAGQVRRGLSVHVDADDLMHAGVMGLIDAASKYEESKDVPFSVYAKHRIRGAVLDSLRQADFVSRQARRQYKQIDAVSRELSAKLGRTPTQEEIAAEMGLDARRWHAVMMEHRSIGHASAQLNRTESDDQPAREIPAPADASPELQFAKSEIRKRVSSAVGSLPERYRQVVTLYYERDMTMKEIGSVLGVNESRVSQIHKTALAKMQLILTSKGVGEHAAYC